MKKTLIIVGISIVSLILIVTFAASPIIKSYVENNGKEIVGRNVSMEDLSFNIFTGHLEIEKLTIYETDESTPFITLDALDLRIDLWDLLWDKCEIESITLSSANISVIQDGDKFNFDDMLEFFMEEDDDEDDDEWEIIIHDIHLENSSFCYKDKELGTEWNMNNLNLIIPGFNLSDIQTNMGLYFNFLNGGEISIDTNYDTEKELYDLQVELKDFKLYPILPYLQQTYNISNVNGNLTTSLHIIGSTEDLTKLAINGNVTISNLNITDNQYKDIVKLDDISTTIKSINLENNLFEIESLAINGLSAFYEYYENETDNITLLFKEDNVDPQQEDSLNIYEIPTIIINNFEVQNAEVTYNDYSLIKPFSLLINKIFLSTKDFNLNEKNEIELSALLGNTGTIKAKFIGNMFDFSNMNISLSVNNVDLNTFSPFSLSMFGNAITNGKLDVQSQNIVVNNQLIGANKINIYNPQIGEKDKSIKSEFNIPLKMALYILTDKKGNVNIDLPVSGDIDSPDFSYKKIIRKALGNFIVKVTTSPFDNGDNNEDEITKKVEFSINSNEFSAEEYSKFDQLAKILQDNPNLQLSLTQEVYYSNAITEYCVCELKKNMTLDNPAYYITTQNANDLLIKEIYCSIPTKSNDITKYANKALKAKGIVLDKKISNEHKAILLYENEMKKQIELDMEKRNILLHNYLSTQCSIPDSSVTISSKIIETSDKKIKDNYRVTWHMRDSI